MTNLSDIPQKTAFLSTAYLPPVQYISKFLLYEDVFIEAHENYQNQSYRNRAVISGPNGLQKLSIPIKKTGKDKIPIQEVAIDYKDDWQTLHWRSIENAYKSSPFFEFYAHAFRPFFEKRFDYLFDFNRQLLETVLRETEIEVNLSFTEQFEKELRGDDYRFGIHPKRGKQMPDPFFRPKSYVQVFSDRFDFFPNLSILDLLFNKGPETALFLRGCIK